MDPYSIVTGLIELVTRLESDRQETLQFILLEKERFKQLNDKLDKEKERRLELLPELVQAGEHYSLML